MIRAVCLVLLFVSGAALGQTPRPRAGLDVTMLASVVSAALAFISPRALDEVSVRQLALWGLATPSVLDSALATQLQDNAVVLLQSGRVIYTRTAPPDDSAAAWGALVADVLSAAFGASAGVRAAGFQGLVTAFLEEVLTHLDPYSRYIPPADADRDRARRSGEAGLGLTLARSGPDIVVEELNSGGPAAEAGIRLGDRIVSIDGRTLRGSDVDDAQEMIDGPEGTIVTLVVRSRRGPARTLEIERAVVPPETVFASRLNDLLVIRIASFSSDTAERLRQELERRLSGSAGRAVRGIVLDLRGNRGGVLRQAVAAAGLLIDNGIVAVTSGRNPQAAHIFRASSGDTAEGRPVVALIDGRSASAAEILAAALADQGRAVVVGSSSLGKGLVQTIANLPDGGELFVSWSRVLAPSGWPIQGLGVLPQVCTSLGPEATTAQLADLDRGVQPMAQALARHRAARAPLPVADILALRNACPATEGRDGDLAAARYLVSHPTAYAAARLTAPR